jgi:hypothetical protein
MANVLAVTSGSGLLHLVTEHKEGEELNPPNGLEAMVRTFSTRHLHQSGDTPSLSWLLVDYWKLHATDGKDKISALASDANDHELDPNYEAAPEVAFTGSTIRLLTRDHLSTRILHVAAIGFSRHLSALPSCVPDWTMPCPNTLFGAVAQTVRYCSSQKYLFIKRRIV